MNLFNPLQTWHWILFCCAALFLAIAVLTTLIFCIRRPVCGKRRSPPSKVQPKSIDAVTPAGAPKTASLNLSVSQVSKSESTKKGKHQSSDADENQAGSLLSDQSFRTKEIVHVPPIKQQFPNKFPVPQSNSASARASISGKSGRSNSAMLMVTTKSIGSGLAPSPSSRKSKMSAK